MKCRLTIIVLWTALTTHINAREGADILQFRAGLPSCMASCSIPDIPVSVCAPMDINCLCDNKDLDNALSACATSRCSKVLQLQIQRLVKTTCGVKVRTPSARAVAINWISFGCAFIAISMRLIGRLPRFGGQYSWDDYAMIICLLGAIVCSTVGQLLVNAGLGQDIWMLSPKQISNVLFYFYLEQFIYIFLVVVPKISITFLYLRLFSDRSFQRQCLVVIVLSILFLVTSFVGTGLQCYPIRHVWEGWQLDTPPRCVEMRIQIYAYAVFNIILDIVVFTLPIRQLLRLHISFRMKMAVISMFSMGIFVTACSVARLATAIKWNRYGRSQNPSYDYMDLAIWSILEIMAGLVCACMPGVANLLQQLWPKVFNTSSEASYADSGPESGTKKPHVHEIELLPRKPPKTYTIHR